jgi:hypothetical protein
MFAEQVSDVFIVDTSGLPSLIPRPLSEYVDCGDCIVREVIRTTDRTRTDISENHSSWRKDRREGNRRGAPV